MDVGNRDGRRGSSIGEVTREQGNNQAHSTGSSLHCWLLGEIRTVGLGGNWGEREQAPPAQGSGRSDAARDPALESAESKPDSTKTKLKKDAETLEFRTQGWLQPPCASAGKRTFMAVSMNQATTGEPIKRQRKTRVIAMGHPYDR